MSCFWSKFWSFFEPEPDNYFGAGPFKPLPKDHPFQRAAYLHDWEFERAHAGENTKRRSQVDSELFWRLTLLARAEIDPEVQCDLMSTICRYWPIARATGGIFWEGEE